MARLIEIEHVEQAPRLMTLHIGDVVVFSALGGRVDTGAEVVELVGVLSPGVLGLNGGIISPQGAPNTVMFWARKTGHANVSVMAGHAWHDVKQVDFHLIVEP